MVSAGVRESEPVRVARALSWISCIEDVDGSRPCFGGDSGYGSSDKDPWDSGMGGSTVASADGRREREGIERGCRGRGGDSKDYLGLRVNCRCWPEGQFGGTRPNIVSRG